VVFQVRDGLLNVLLWQRAASPFEGAWALPGGPLGPGERLGASAGRHLVAKVALTEVAHLEGDMKRSERHERTTARRAAAGPENTSSPPQARR